MADAVQQLLEDMVPDFHLMVETNVLSKVNAVLSRLVVVRAASVIFCFHA